MNQSTTTISQTACQCALRPTRWCCWVPHVVGERALAFGGKHQRCPHRFPGSCAYPQSQNPKSELTCGPFASLGPTCLPLESLYRVPITLEWVGTVLQNLIPLYPWRVDPATSWLTHGPHISDKDNLLFSIHTSGNAQALPCVGTRLAQFYGMQIELVFILLI